MKNNVPQQNCVMDAPFVLHINQLRLFDQIFLPRPFFSSGKNVCKYFLSETFFENQLKMTKCPPEKNYRSLPVLKNFVDGGGGKRMGLPPLQYP